MGRVKTFLRGVGIGAGAMYLLDPVAGGRRRALLRDKTSHLWNRTETLLSTTTQDLRNRAQGVAHDVQLVTEEGRLPTHAKDALLAIQVKAYLLRATRHPQGIHVNVQDGRAVLRGTALSREVDDIVSAASSVPGIDEVSNHLKTCATVDELPDTETSVALWLLPAAESREGQMLLTGGGGTLLLWGVLRRGLVGAALSAVGVGLLVRGLGGDKLQRLIDDLVGEIQAQRGDDGQGATGAQSKAPSRRDAGQPASKDPGQSGKDPGQSGKDPGQAAGKDPGQATSKAQGSPASKDPGQPEGKDPGQPAARTHRPPLRSQRPPAARNGGAAQQDAQPQTEPAPLSHDEDDADTAAQPQE